MLGQMGRMFGPQTLPMTSYGQSGLGQPSALAGYGMSGKAIQPPVMRPMPPDPGMQAMAPPAQMPSALAPYGEQAELLGQLPGWQQGQSFRDWRQATPDWRQQLPMGWRDQWRASWGTLQAPRSQGFGWR